MPLWLFLILWGVLQLGIVLMTPNWTAKQRVGSQIAAGAAYLILVAELAASASWFSDV
jgi:hypothetical protein